MTAVHLKRPLKWVPCSNGCINRTLVLATWDEVVDGPAFCSPRCEQEMKMGKELVAKGLSLNHFKNCPGGCFGYGIVDNTRWGWDKVVLCDGVDWRASAKEGAQELNRLVEACKEYRYEVTLPGCPTVVVPIPPPSVGQPVTFEVKETPVDWTLNVAPNGITTEWRRPCLERIFDPAHMPGWWMVATVLALAALVSAALWHG